MSHKPQPSSAPATKPATSAPQAPKRVSIVPKDETPEATFTRLATSRVNKALKALKGIENLGTSRYSYTAEQLSKVTGALQKALDSATTRLQNRLSGAKTGDKGPGFTF